jgi:hypothetical protein
MAGELASGSTEDATSRDTGTPELLQAPRQGCPHAVERGSDHGELSEKKVRWIAQACGDILLSS